MKESCKVNHLALQYYQKCFSSQIKVQDYVFSRISKETADKFHVGYAPRDGLIDFLNANNVQAELAQELGLIGINEDGTAYEMFRHRIMLPIIKCGLVIGFGGRVCNSKYSPKYLNSRASKLYNKSDTLYGLNLASKYIHQEGCAILVEGYFDVLGLWDAGIRNVVACCGTSIGELHALLLSRWTEKVYVCYDGDDAGRDAVKKARKVLGKQGLEVGVIDLPDGLDPDVYVGKYGAEALKKLLTS